LEQQDLNKRLLLALALSFLVFVGYSYLFQPKTGMPAEENLSTQAVPLSAADKSVPAIAAKQTVAKDTKMTNAAPHTGQDILTTIVSPAFKMSIDTLGRIAQFELLEKKYQNAEGHNLQIFGVH